jgi:hypothetical protein
VRLSALASDILMMCFWLLGIRVVFSIPLELRICSRLAPFVRAVPLSVALASGCGASRRSRPIGNRSD